MDKSKSQKPCPQPKSQPDTRYQPTPKAPRGTTPTDPRGIKAGLNQDGA